MHVMKTVSAARQTFDGFRNGFLPIRNLMPLKDYVRARRVGPFVQSTGRVNGFTIDYADSIGFLHSAKEIFADKIYCFKTNANAPRIIDAGANIGLSVLYFKGLYPDANITAFEPDPLMFSLLSANVIRAGFSDVDRRQSAAWTEDTTLTFYQEGIAGRFYRSGFLVYE